MRHSLGLIAALLVSSSTSFAGTATSGGIPSHLPPRPTATTKVLTPSPFQSLDVVRPIDIAIWESNFNIPSTSCTVEFSPGQYRPDTILAGTHLNVVSVSRVATYSRVVCHQCDPVPGHSMCPPNPCSTPRLISQTVDIVTDDETISKISCKDSPDLSDSEIVKHVESSLSTYFEFEAQPDPLYTDIGVLSVKTPEQILQYGDKAVILYGDYNSLSVGLLDSDAKNQPTLKPLFNLSFTPSGYAISGSKLYVTDANHDLLWRRDLIDGSGWEKVDLRPNPNGGTPETSYSGFYFDQDMLYLVQSNYNLVEVVDLSQFAIKKVFDMPKGDYNQIEFSNGYMLELYTGQYSDYPNLRIFSTSDQKLLHQIYFPGSIDGTSEGASAMSIENGKVLVNQYPRSATQIFDIASGSKTGTLAFALPPDDTKKADESSVVVAAKHKLKIMSSKTGLLCSTYRIRNAADGTLGIDSVTTVGNRAWVTNYDQNTVSMIDQLKMCDNSK